MSKNKTIPNTLGTIVRDFEKKNTLIWKSIVINLDNSNSEGTHDNH